MLSSCIEDQDIHFLFIGDGAMKQAVVKIVDQPQRPELWDGHAAERCLDAIIDYPEKHHILE